MRGGKPGARPSSGGKPGAGDRAASGGPRDDRARDSRSGGDARTGGDSRSGGAGRTGGPRGGFQRDDRARDTRSGGGPGGPRGGFQRDDRARDNRTGGERGRPRDDHARDERAGDAARDARDQPRAADVPPKLPRINGPGERVVYGAGPVRELIARNPQRVRAIWVDPRRADKSAGDPVALVVTYARQASIVVDDREREHLDRAAEGGRHQGVVAWLGEFTYTPLERLILPDEPAMLIALDGVEDPRNLGAVLRSAYLLGAHGAIIPEHRAALVTPLVAKASAGASELLPIALVPNLVRTLEELRELGVWRIAVHAAPDAQRIDQIDGLMPHVLVLGSEGSGVRPLVAKHCDFHAVIPMQRAGVGSFNVSVAAALALYELRRQRLQSAR
jgi:23S rRNA (guanosine2251-2'-O)-methyltransferase